MSEDFAVVTDETFEEEVLKNELPVLVDLWAGWCAPCQLVVPSLEYLTQNYSDQMRIVKLDVDENPKMASRYGIMSIPTLLFFKDGELRETIVGALPREKIVEVVSKHL